MTPLWEQSKRSWHSEIRVWARGAVGAGNLYAEEMGIWGELKLENLYRNPDGNPIFWDEVLLDAVLAESNLTLLLNTQGGYPAPGRLQSICGGGHAAGHREKNHGGGRLVPGCDR